MTRPSPPDAVVFGGPDTAVGLAVALARWMLPATVGVRAAHGLREWPAPVCAALAHAGIPLPVLTGDDPPGEAGFAIALTHSASDACATRWYIPKDAGPASLEALAASLSRLSAELAPPPAVGLIGGSGFYDLPGLTGVRRLLVDTPFGAPSDGLVEGWLAGRRVLFLARHGKGHALLPSEVNARANLHALKRSGAARIVSVSAVGSLREEIAPGDVVLPRQFIDRTRERPSTFYGSGAVAHVGLAEPVCGGLADALADAARVQGERVHPEGTYVCIEGPQFSTRAESVLHRSWGAAVVGMTNLPEARLAREAEQCYATVTLPTDWDCWRPRDDVHATDVLGVLRANVDKAKRLIAHAISQLDPAAPCACQRVLDAALVTPLDRLPLRARVVLHPLLARRLAAPQGPSL